MGILKDRDRAIKILEEFRDNKLKAGLRDRDTADALFNIACYYCREIDGVRPQGWEDKALTLLRESIRIAPANAADAREDRDFDPLRASSKKEEFEALTSETATTQVG